MPEMNRMKSMLISLNTLRIKNAAIKIQATFRRFYLQKKFHLCIFQKYKIKVDKIAVKIQASWRRYKTICTMKKVALYKLIQSHYIKNANKIFHWL